MGDEKQNRKRSRSESSSEQSDSSTSTVKPRRLAKPLPTKVLNEKLFIQCRRFASNARSLVRYNDVNDVETMRTMVIIADHNIETLKEAHNLLIKKLTELNKPTEATTWNEPSTAATSKNLPNEDLFSRLHKQISTLAASLNHTCAQFLEKAKSLYRSAKTDDVEKMERMKLVTDDNIGSLLNARCLLNNKLSTFRDENQGTTPVSNQSTDTLSTTNSSDSELTWNSLQPLFNVYPSDVQTKILQLLHLAFNNQNVMDDIIRRCSNFEAKKKNSKRS